ncbi:hypothetical protein TNCV_2378611 [Trichonephila clavipes]|nr:hypothetical protein TNCV_2378611 [Trichonephila clavipes]
MNENRNIKKVFNAQPNGPRRKGRTSLRMVDGLEKDLLVLRTRNWRTLPLVYADKPQTLDHLEDNIRRVIADIRPQMLEKVIENWTSRLDYIRQRGSPMPEIIFKM